MSAKNVESAGAADGTVTVGEHNSLVGAGDQTGWSSKLFRSIRRCPAISAFTIPFSTIVGVLGPTVALAVLLCYIGTSARDHCPETWGAMQAWAETLNQSAASCTGVFSSLAWGCSAFAPRCFDTTGVPRFASANAPTVAMPVPERISEEGAGSGMGAQQATAAAVSHLWVVNCPSLLTTRPVMLPV